ncbi:hypothetical protein M408DRAFT_18806 [Serendipita vermifera MAFF 305830]|uniref:RNA-dependent RNA polymerase n=1 Tax=Serendipita vermifera MAFF 305830 TaxID=933852 RepID=A0A0C3BQS3_SERVB|nr:hypothetical protein M408DRAFT_18806 [Serendipita vermifera MAFF 305830]
MATETEIVAKETETIATDTVEEEEVVHQKSRRWKGFKIYDIPPQAEIHDVKKAIAKSYHSVVLDCERFRRRTANKGEDGYLLPNLEIKLKLDDRGTGRLHPRGDLLIPSWAQEFKQRVDTNPIQVPFAPDWNRKDVLQWQTIRLVENYEFKARREFISSLLTSPWQDPLLELKHKQRIESLRETCDVQEIQFGFDHFQKYTNKQNQRIVHRFVVEWARRFESTDARAHIEFQDAISSICIVIGPESTRHRQFCKVRYDSIKYIEVKAQTIIFNLWSAPIFEEGPIEYDEGRPRLRLAGLDEQHKRVVSRFATKFRVTLYGGDILSAFLKMTKVVGLAIRSAHKDLDTDDGLSTKTNAKARRRQGDHLNELSDIKIDQLNNNWLAGVPYSIAFQIAAMLQNGLLNPIEIGDLRPSIDELIKPGSPRKTEEIARLLFRFSQSIPTWTFAERFTSTLQQKFNKFADMFWAQGSNLANTPKAGWFWVYRATLTPTTLRLSGPFQEQSNGVIRQYDYATDHFLRINFTDEQRLQLRWDRDVRGDLFVKEHIGGLLKEGINIAGRYFEFLGYSNSGLREHSVWFVTPIWKEMGLESTWITAEDIRNGIADFSMDADLDTSTYSPVEDEGEPESIFFGDASVISRIKEGEKELKFSPSKLGARLAQAFTTTEPAIELRLDEIEFIDDIKVKNPISGKPTEFTDGYGCLSCELANDVWKVLNAHSHSQELPIPAPSAYQIRLGGAKGVLGINPDLEGRKVVLHKSMVKFLSQDGGLHIATRFDHPLNLYLNRPLIAILEHLGVAIDWFSRLQAKAISEANETLLSISDEASEFLTTRHLGRQYGFPFIMRGLTKYGVTRALLEDAPHPMLDFFLCSLSVAIVHIDRELKYKARIPVPSGLSLVGGADVHQELDEWCVYICTQKTDETKHKYFPEMLTQVDEKGRPFGYVYVTRSPSIHPGDVQRFKAMHPPRSSPYWKHPMVNCIIFSCKGGRPPASMLGGGDLDGDIFQIIPEANDFKPDVNTQPADYASVPTRKLDRPATIDDIADFVVDYINSDKMGLVSIQHLIISDQSRHGLHDKKCLKLAELHSKAVDFAKSGVPVRFEDLPKRNHRYIPDFQRKEATLDDQTNYYESPKALGVLFRAIKVRTMEQLQEERKSSRKCVAYNKHPFYQTLVNICMQKKVARGLLNEAATKEIRKAFESYSTELQAIKSIYSIGRSPLTEPEVFMGTILEESSQRRSRDDMAARLREVSSQLVDCVRVFFQGDREEHPHMWLVRSMFGLQIALSPEKALNAKGQVVAEWKDAQCSFGMIALRSAFECVDVLDKRRPDPRRPKAPVQVEDISKGNATVWANMNSRGNVR